MEALSHKWIVEYLCNFMWREFKQTLSIPDGRRDLIQGILNLSACPKLDPVANVQLHLLSLQCFLVDGEDCISGYSNELTVLEVYLCYFLEMIRNQGLQETDFQDFITALKEQAVLVCCRKDDFDMAKAVYHRVFEEKRAKSKTQKRLEQVLKSEDEDHPVVTKHCYSVFQEQAMEVMQGVHDTFNTPFLERASMSVLKSRESNLMEVVEDMIGDEYDQNRNRAEHQTDLCSKAIQETAEALGIQNWKPDHQKHRLNRKCSENRKRVRLDEEGKVLANLQEINDSGDAEKEATASRERVQVDERQHGEVTAADANRIILDSRHVVKQLDHAFKKIEKTAHHAYGYKRNRNRKNRHRHSMESSYDDSQGSSSDSSDVGHLPDLGKKPVLRKSLNLSLSNSEGNKSKYKFPSCRVPWSDKEVQLLKEGVERFGKGNWAVIRDSYKFNGRTSVNLKDKWRNIEAKNL